MLIDRVIYKFEDKERVITIFQMLQEDTQLIKNHLFCAEEGCNCKISYVPQGLHSAHFKKWPGIDFQHSSSCIYHRDNTIGRKAIRREGENNISLDTTRKRRISREMYNKYCETSEEKEVRLNRSRDLRNRRAQTITDTTLGTTVATLDRITTDPSAEVSTDGSKNARLKRRYSIKDINQENINDTLIIMGPLTNIETDFNNTTEKRSILTISDAINKNIEFKIFLDPVFFVNSIFATDSVIESLQISIANGEEYILGSIGQIINRNDNLAMAVYNVNDLTLNGRSLFSLRR